MHLPTFFQNSLHQQSRKKYVLTILLSSIIFAIPCTTLQYFDLQYRIKHDSEMQYVTNEWVNTVDQSRITNYGYRPTPWEMSMRISILLFLSVPALLTVFLSMLHLYQTKGSLTHRYTEATFFATSIIPIFYVCNLPWGFIYWVGGEWYVGSIVLIVYSCLIVLGATMFNGILASYLYVLNQKNKKLLQRTGISA